LGTSLPGEARRSEVHIQSIEQSMPLSLTTLPIAKRGSELFSFDAAEEGTGLSAGRRAAVGFSSCSSTSASDGGDERSVTVKNTFLDVSYQPCGEDFEEEQRGAQTWSLGAWTAQTGAARLLEPQRPRVDDDGPCLFESTPWGDSPAARAASLLPQEPAREVLLQVPLRVCPGHPLAAGALGGLEVEVRHEDGQTVVSLRIGARRSGDVALASPPFVASAAPSTASSQTSSRASSPTAAKGGAAPPPPSAPPRRAGAKGAGARPAGEKCSMVCCHWKNKGWCKYQDTCKFQHPDHKKGAGLAAAALAATAALAQQQQQQQRREPSAAAHVSTSPDRSGVSPAAVTGFGLPPAPPPPYPPMLPFAFPMGREAGPAVAAVPAR